MLKARIDGRPSGAPAVASPKGSRLGLENWKRAVCWPTAIAQIGREKMRVHDYADIGVMPTLGERCCRPGVIVVLGSA